MRLPTERSQWCLGDLEHYAAWYDREADWDVAERYLDAVARSIGRLAEMPEMGYQTSFHAPELRGIRCWPVERPFQKHLIFYRYDERVLRIERVVHGSRDLVRRLRETPHRGET